MAEPDLERFRAYLTLLSRAEIDPRLQGKIDLSGVVQQTLLEAHLARHARRGLERGPAGGMAAAVAGP